MVFYGISTLVSYLNPDTVYRYISNIYGVMVIVVGNGHGDTSSNPRRDWLHFT